MKFKVGDRIEFVSAEDEHSGYAEKIGAKGTIEEIEDYLVHVDWDDDNLYFSPYFKNIEKIRGDMKITSLDQLELGKAYVDKDGDEETFIVLDLDDDCAVFKCSDSYGGFDYKPRYLKTLIRYEYRLKTEPKGMTVSEISKELGYEVKIIKGE